MKNSNPLIFGLKELALSSQEREFFLKTNPFGFILFKRNCATREQITALTSSLKALFPERKVEIFIDQEGGRVARIKPPIASREYPAPRYFAQLYKDQGQEIATKALYANYYELMRELVGLGITSTCAPLADLLFEGADQVIGDRSFGSDPKIVSELCKVTLKALQEAGGMGLLKHIPGHGRATCDSHKELPTLSTSLEDLESTDFLAFKLIAPYAKYAMTAHIKFDALDSLAPVTLSKPAVDYIRHKIGFKGLLMTDDMSMKALNGDIGELSALALEAGCDLILHCNGEMDEMKKIATIFK